MNKLSEIVSTLLSRQLTDDQKPSIYFIGVGGIGMSALARYFNARNCKVSGYDKTATLLCKKLEVEGIQIHYEDNTGLLDKQAAIVVYTPAVPQDHKELTYYRQNNYTVVKRSEILGAITEGLFNICVAGTHGKTTTSTMVAHILRDSDYGCNAFLGGIAANYNSNFWSSENNICVVEADEYDRSFLKLNPDVAIITSMDPDHLDIYGTAENVEQAFIDFSAKVKIGGLLIVKYGLSRLNDLSVSTIITYHSSNTNADVYATNIKVVNGGYCFDVISSKDCWVLEQVKLNMGGMHNVENVLAAIAVAHHIGITDEKINIAVANFKGVKRRFEYIIPPVNMDKDNVVMIDDYAHHPEELRGLIAGAKNIFPGRKCTIIFQPHLYSRTRDFADGFAEVLDMADEVILLPIYPARELPIAGVTSEMIIDKMHGESRMVLSKEDLLIHLKQEKDAHVEEGFEGLLVITAGAGDIDTMVEPIRKLLTD